ncbi:expressed unknown protein [Seminavis robusta]|uniref:Uncharacterized protein n=1 Tax=Seminavis robusta TaxID=568900 RepID=A0A9N8HHK9_9STRA|nr:expressed unknown protein [Seminavis robusta]|eukprot:Sro453_g146220.1 n/a (80) ;mRNA; f:55422-55759
MNATTDPANATSQYSIMDSISLFGLIDGGKLRNGVVAEALPTAASLVCVFDESPATSKSCSSSDLLYQSSRLGGAGSKR